MGLEAQFLDPVEDVVDLGLGDVGAQNNDHVGSHKKPPVVRS
jgi:hypothetical protein